MKYRYQSGETIYEVMLERHGDGYRVTIDGETYDLEVLDAQPGALTLALRPRPATTGPARGWSYWGAEGDGKWLSSGGCTYRLDRPSERRAAAQGSPRQARTRSARRCRRRCARCRSPKATRSRPGRPCSCSKR